MCRWGPPTSFGGMAVDLGSTDTGREACWKRVHLRSPPPIHEPVSTWDSSILSSSLSRDHPPLQSGVVGSATGGGGLHSCLARARARALRRGFAGLVTKRYERDHILRPSPHARPRFGIQSANRNVPVGPATGGGLAATLSLFGLKIGWVVGCARIVYVFIVEDRRQVRSESE
ncbi:hypothetical protein SCHPADRAFT_537120 [Schizopora paradoxa]|uniref:Uncharacterized protein n=1 Tax=Schizopora paradoxa TaxID=27342 RepID=A0A0H2RDX9_9AGAM|nr:hypothetical protein SCHPADRAFT_537120 [Schizopora paradoxa]